MENIIEKLGVYDFFAAFIPGMATTGFLIFLGMKFLNPETYIENDVIVVTIFCLESYIIGIVLQEISSFLDRILRIRKDARSNFLNNKKIIPIDNERNEVKNIANEILRKEKDNALYTSDECEYVFLKCKSVLEINNMIGKSERINSLYAMSRGLAVSCLSATFVMFYKMLYVSEKKYMIPAVCMCIITFILYRRCKMYCEYYTRVVFRHYIMWKEKNKKSK